MCTQSHCVNCNSWLQVNHSQKLSEKPLTPWIIAEQDGKLLAGHCDCMAGLGETCSHVASLLWAIEAGVRIRDSKTVTDKHAYWIMPNGVKDVHYAPVREMDFIGKKKSQSAMQNLSFSRPSLSGDRGRASSSCERGCSSSSGERRRNSKSPTPAFEEATQEESDKLLEMLGTCKSKPVVLSLVEKYASKYAPKALDEDLPICLSTLYNPKYLSLNYHELLKFCEECSITVLESEARAVEKATKQQSKSKVWFSMRTGRITASRFKAASHTDPLSPSISLIKSICYPELSKFRTAATEWGCVHEQNAREKYIQVSKMAHNHFEVHDSGLFIHTEFPFIGASPDGLVTCICCSEGILEVKVCCEMPYIIPVRTVCFFYVVPILS